MNKYSKRTLAAYLASATISMSTGVSEAALPKPEEFPADFMDNMIEELGESEMADEKKLDALRLIAKDRRADVRIRICTLLAEKLEAENWFNVAPLFAQLASDDDFMVRAHFAQALHAALDHATVLERTQLVTEWALSDEEPVRFVLSEVLAEDFFCLGVSAIAAHLASDESARVRMAVVSVAASRLHENERQYLPILEKLAMDDDEDVKSAAQISLLCNADRATFFSTM